jgi:hypothetical protein
MGWFRKDPEGEKLKAALKAALDAESRYERAAGSGDRVARRSAEALRAAEAAEAAVVERQNKSKAGHSAKRD